MLRRLLCLSALLLAPHATHAQNSSSTDSLNTSSADSFDSNSSSFDTNSSASNSSLTTPQGVSGCTYFEPRDVLPEPQSFAVFATVSASSLVIGIPSCFLYIHQTSKNLEGMHYPVLMPCVIAFTADFGSAIFQTVIAASALTECTPDENPLYATSLLFLSGFATSIATGLAHVVTGIVLIDTKLGFHKRRLPQAALATGGLISLGLLLSSHGLAWKAWYDAETSSSP